MKLAGIKTTRGSFSFAPRIFAIVAVLLTTSPTTIRADVVFVSNNTSSTIERLDSDTGVRLGIFASTGLMYPYGLAFDSAGNLYAANGGGWIQKFDPNGFGWSILYSANGPIGLAFDKADSLYASSWMDNAIMEVTSGSSIFASGLNGPAGLAFDKTGTLYVANYNAGEIMTFTPNGIGSTFASGLSGPMGLAFDAAGNLYVSMCDGNAIEKFTPGGIRSTFATGLNVPAGLAFDTTGNLYAVNFGGNTIEKFTPGGVRSIFATDLSGPAYIAIQTVPEPSAWLLLGLGLPILVFCRRREGNRAISARIGKLHG